MKKYICDKCNKEFEFKDEITICPYCGYKYLRDMSKPMKKIIKAKCSITGVMKVVKHEDGTIEPLFFEGEKITEIVGDIQSEKDITNIEYEKCDKYIWIPHTDILCILKKI